MGNEEIRNIDVIGYITREKTTLGELVTINKVVSYELERKLDQHNKILEEL